ncbi:MAG: hypothetical protein OXE41_00750 [Gammaproteobacteria bacterium]|nr:hypothetical protein [Gammaproteobacteria bacterium]MCY4273920.1 hypothetical protein [Gammaproteobacteria bacterium]
MCKNRTERCLAIIIIVGVATGILDLPAHTRDKLALPPTPASGSELSIVNLHINKIILALWLCFLGCDFHHFARAGS